MIALLLTAFGTFAEETSQVVGKLEMKRNEETPFALAMLQVALVAAFFLGKALFQHPFGFQAASLPTFLLCQVLEIAELYAMAVAIASADRTTLGFIRVMTIPVLVGIDLLLGYTLSVTQLMGMLLICCTILFLALAHDLNRKGIGLCIFVAVNAAATISLYKYNIAHFNTVEAEAGLSYLVLFIFALIGVRWRTGQNPLKYFTKPIFLFQSLTYAVAAVFMSYAYIFAAASVITALKRSFNVFWSIISGRILFHEDHMAAKLVGTVALMIGIILLSADLVPGLLQAMGIG